jgi:hypothetical protein
LDIPTFHREIEKQPKHRTHVRRRRGGRLVALGGFALLAGGLTLGGWGNYSLKQEVMATAKQQHDFVPSFNRNGMQVAVINNGKAELRKVNVKRDLGTRVEVDSGIKAGDQVILSIRRSRSSTAARLKPNRRRRAHRLVRIFGAPCSRKPR